MAGFVFTDHMVTVSNQLWAITSGVGAGLCFVLLLFILALNLHPASRKHLDRVSFRLLQWALVANMFFGIFSAVGGSLTGPGFLCGFSIFVLQLTLEWSCLLLFCIALNLQLVVVHHVNGQKMEKFYLLGSAFFALGITVPPYAAKQYGWDPLVQDCWYTNDNQRQRLAWQIGTQLVWTGLTVIGEVVASVTVIVYMLRHKSRRRNLGASSLNSAATSYPSSAAPSGSGLGKKLMRPVDHANAYRGIIFRIGLYPLTSCIINLTSIMCVVHATVTDGVHNYTDYNILLLSDFLYGGRAVVYALLAATDPALLRAAHAFLAHYNLIRRIPYYPSRDTKSHSHAHSQEVYVSFELDTVHSPRSLASAGATPAKTGLGKSDSEPILAESKTDDVEMGGEEERPEIERPFRDVQVTVQEADVGLGRRREREREREEGSDLFRRQI